MLASPVEPLVGFVVWHVPNHVVQMVSHLKTLYAHNTLYRLFAMSPSLLGLTSSNMDDFIVPNVHKINYLAILIRHMY